MQSKSLTWGLIGASDVAQTRMIKEIRSRGDFIQAVFSNSSQRAQEFAESNGIPHGTVVLGDILRDPEIEAVYISSTNDMHFAQATAALRSGKHVLVEKPLALTTAEASALVRTAEEEGVVLAVNHHLPASPLHVEARSLVEQGSIGEILSIRIRHAVMLPERLRGWRIGKGAPGGGLLLDQVSHDASVLNPLLGNRPRRIATMTARQASWNPEGSEDAAMSVIEYLGADKVVLVQIHNSYAVEYDTTTFEIQGTLGSITIRDAMTQDASGTVSVTNAKGTSNIEIDTSVDLYSIILNAFASAVAGTGSPTASGRDGELALMVALAACESSESGRFVDIEC